MEYLPLPEFQRDADIERINKALAHYGLYDISADVYPVTEHDDEAWALPHTYLEGME